ncbi:MAG: flavin reductase [Candidatus Eisenbacteria bacterium]|nr:flavin reductase [Candidatus Eisenbacteria bacterium]
MAKELLDVARIARLVNHGPTVLASCRHEGVRNIITLAWCMPVSIDPPMLAISVAPARFSHHLIEGSGQFAVNVPGAELLPAVWHCGTRSGRDADKFEGAGLTAAGAETVGCPLIRECFAHIECSVVDSPEEGDHTVFVGVATSASVEAEAFDGHLRLVEPYHTLHHLGGSRFLSSSGELLTAG